MKKSIILIAILIAISSSISTRADVVNEDNAREIATAFLSQRHNGHRLNNSNLTELSLAQTRFSSSDKATPVYYVFNDASLGGWVMVAADDRAQQVLGYSELGQFDVDEIPCNMRSWIDGYCEQIEYLQCHPEIKSIATPRQEQPLNEITPMLTTVWGQSKPFNNQCPKVSGYYSTHTGCVATAMAQVMFYHRFPSGDCRGIPAYTSKRGINLPALPPVTFDWDNMTTDYSYSYTTDQATAVSQLMRYCGQSVEMDYGTNSSDASLAAIPFALNYYFGFSRSAMIVMNDSTNEADWEQMIYDDLASGLPVIYSGRDASYGSHAFVLDGYRDGMFHINWGWSGDANSYWQLSALTPKNYNFSTRHYAILGVGRNAADINDDGIIDIVDVTALISMVLNGNSVQGRIGDLNHDNELDVTDITALISMVLTGDGQDEPEGESFTVNGETFRMVKVEGGTFEMGASDELADDALSNEFPAHQVTLSTYYIGKTEVTQGLWKAVMGTNPSAVHGVELPVGGVSWNDCMTFIERLNALTGRTFRLPTEAEWEFAARGGNRSRKYIYAGGNDIDAVAWYYDNGRYSYGRRVATKLPNELGLYDMCGNNYEWCADFYGEYSAEAQTNPQGPATGNERVVRSGSWYTPAYLCRSTSRELAEPGLAAVHIGFRLAL